MAVGITEHFLRRAMRNVGDIGCGEAPWLTHLRELRPKVRYAGFDPSDYVVERFGAIRASFGDLPLLKIRERFDLVVCADVLHYLDDDEIRRGFPTLVRLMRGAAYLEALTREDDIVGDKLGLILRPAAWYRQLFASAGLAAVGPYMWITPKVARESTALGRP